MPEARQTVRSLVGTLKNDVGGLRQFSSYLMQTVALIGDEPVVASFSSYDDGYGNLAVLTPSYVVDVEGDDDDSDGCLAVYLLGTIESVALYEGSVESIPGTSDTSLTLIVNHIYEPSGPWWITEDDEEKVRLQSFASSLLAAVRSLQEK